MGVALSLCVLAWIVSDQLFFLEDARYLAWDVISVVFVSSPPRRCRVHVAAGRGRRAAIRPRSAHHSLIPSRAASSARIQVSGSRVSAFTSHRKWTTAPTPAEVDQPVQRLPAPAEPPRRGASRGGRQAQQHQEGREAHRDVGALEDVLAQERPLEPEVEAHVGGQVQARVEEGEEPQGPALEDERAPAAEPPDRRHHQAQHQEAQRPQAGGVRHRLDGVRAEIVQQRAPGQRHQRARSPAPGCRRAARVAAPGATPAIPSRTTRGFGDGLRGDRRHLRSSSAGPSRRRGWPPAPRSR